jgi:putative nucleotidyltransferase with HDIG domain
MINKEIFLDIEKHLLNDDKPSIYLIELLKVSALDKYPLSMIKELQEVPQNPKFHPEGNVFIHTMLVIDEGAKIREKSIDKRSFMWALLLHDIGKKPTTKTIKGRLTSYDHDIVGANMTREFLTHFNEEENFIVKVTALVRWHMQSLYVNKNLKFQNISSMLDEVNINEIVLISLSDRLGRGSLDYKEVEETIIEVNKFKEKMLNSP